MRLPALVVMASIAVVLSSGFLPPAAPPETARGTDGEVKSARVERPLGRGRRPLWTTSKITGSPEPPPPYRVARAFPKLKFVHPVELTAAPGTDRLFLVEQSGKIYSFPNDQSSAQPDLFFDLASQLQGLEKEPEIKGLGSVFGLTFHPRFAENGYLYICYVLDPKKGGEMLPMGSRVSRFRVLKTDPPRVDPGSETVLVRWLAGGHNGGCLKFGPDGFLYITTGDTASPTPPDPLDTGQDISDLLSSILRIDVDHADPGKTYAIPADNPFRDLSGARGEVWSFGFRNPWKMSFDRGTGDLWVGDVGWEMWELVYRVQRGGNYGWSVMEGRQPVRPEARRGPTPILPPTIDYPHSEGASVTGGFVYRGAEHPDLVGTYIYGDWVSHKIWGARFDGKDVTSNRVLAQGNSQIIVFGEDNWGELFIVGYDDGMLGQLVPDEASRGNASFPRTLSQTGLFASVEDHEPSPGVLPFSINAEPWADHAVAERLVAVPGATAIEVIPGHATRPDFAPVESFKFPGDGVLARTFSLEMKSGHPESRRRLETQVLHFDGQDWRGYTYAWNDAQTDADLVAAEGMDRTFVVTDPEAPGGRREQAWHFPSRAECLTCHNSWSGYRLAFNPLQLDKDHAGADQLESFMALGLLVAPKGGTGSRTTDGGKPAQKLTNPYDPSANLDERARSYLQVNCAHCHQFGAGGTANIQLRYDTPLEKAQILDVRPTQGTFGVYDARIVAHGDPYRSVLFYRMAKLGPGRMPRLGSELLDEDGLRLLRDWIAQGPPGKVKVTPDAGRKPADPAATPGLEGLAARPPQARAAAISQMLGSTGGALRLARALGEASWPDGVRAEVLAAATAHPEGQVRDLFEPYVPPSGRAKRLGNTIRPGELLALKGDAARGQELFFNASGVSCKDCHQVAGRGGAIGPDLTLIGKKHDRAGLLESLLEPSKAIEPKYVAYLVETAEGQVHSGLLVEKTAETLTLRTAQNKEIRIPARDVEQLVPQRQSLMPELLLRDLTPEQAADLLEFLGSLR